MRISTKSHRKFSILLGSLFCFATIIGLTFNNQVSAQISDPPTVDGIIGEQEYNFSANFGGGIFNLYWYVDNDDIYFAMSANNNAGWIAVGFEPEFRMQGADIIFAWVSSANVTTIFDTYANAPVGSHPVDTDLGGTNDILSSAGTEVGGVTTVEFSRKLNSSDIYDKNISTEVPVNIIWSFGNADSFSLQHSSRGSGIFQILTGEQKSEKGPFTNLLIPTHALLMSFGGILMMIGMFIARFKKEQAWWFKTHRLIGLLSSLFLIIGLSIAIIMVISSTGVHFRVPHTWIALVSLIFAFSTPILGLSMVKLGERGNKLRKIHRFFGRTTIILIIVTMIFGINQAINPV
jgi:hypothetical protein